MDFKTTRRPTAYGYFDADPAFQRDADAFLVYAQRMLGHRIVSVELARDHYWTSLEAAAVKWSNLINEYDFTSYMTDLIGKPRPLQTPVRPEDTGNIAGKLVAASHDFFDWRTGAFSEATGLSGDFTPAKGVILTEPEKQIYNLKTDLYLLEDVLDNNASVDGLTPLWANEENIAGKRLRILQIYHWDNSYTALNFRPRAAVNLFVTDIQQGRQGRFNFQFMLPVFDDMLRSQHLKEANKLRRSPFTWRLQGTNIHVFPRPRVGRAPGALFFDVVFVAGWIGSGLEGDQPITDSNYDPTTDYTKDGFITNLSNVPMGLYEYSSINAIGREWIRDYALALCKISLGNVRSKYSNFPIPSDTLSLNGGDLVSQGQAERDALIEGLRDRLDKLTLSAALERKAAETENLSKIQGYVAPKKPFYIA